MRRMIFSLAAVLAFAGCDRAITEPYGPLTGTWRYTATGFQYWSSEPGVKCTLEAVIKVRQEGNSIEGEQTEPAPFFCTYPDGRVHFSNAGGWHSFGELGPDRVEGYLESYGGEPVRAVRSGSFVLERVSDDGYYGPRA